MDISNLLSPCVDTVPPQASSSLGRSDTVSILNAATSNNGLEPLSQQIVALAHSRASASGRRLQTTAKAPAVLLETSGAKKKPRRQQPVKRERKRNLTAKQLQIKSENQQDESQLYNLTLDINDLKQQVRDYMVRKSIHETRSLVNRQRFNAGVMRTTQHYFNLLRTGYRQWQPQEAAFFASMFDPDVSVKSTASSVVFLFNKWRMYKMLLQMRYFGISSIRILVSDAESCVVECEGEFEGKLTLAVIEALFPHILQDQQMLEKVVNRRLVCPTRTLIYFDASGRIIEYNAHADMFAGLNRILASTPMDVISLMSNAHIRSHDTNERFTP